MTQGGDQVRHGEREVLSGSRRRQEGMEGKVVIGEESKYEVMNELNVK